MFDLFGKSKYKVPEPQPIWKSGPKPVEKPDEYFRVGATYAAMTEMCVQ